MSDDLLEQQHAGRLVPFSPEFLEVRARKGRKPGNWIEESDYSSACRRLRESAEATPA